MKLTKLVIVFAIMIGSLIFTADLMANVTQVKVGVSPKSHSGMCPKKFEFGAKIFVDKAGPVTYKWIRSDGAQSPIETIGFKKPGNQKVLTSWTLGKPGTHWQALQILRPNPMVSKKAVFTLKCFPVSKIDPIVVPPKLPPKQSGKIPEIIKKQCPDPAAHEIKFEIAERYSQFTGKIRITGIVKNIGAKAFQSGPHQAKAILYELPAGIPPANATTGRIIKEQEFTSLAPNATLQLIYELDWNSSSPSQGEFPTSYRLLITYDPDIYIDDNPDNDDCNQNNNKKDRSGTEINDMLR